MHGLGEGPNSGRMTKRNRERKRGRDLDEFGEHAEIGVGSDELEERLLGNEERVTHHDDAVAVAEVGHPRNRLALDGWGMG